MLRCSTVFSLILSASAASAHIGLSAPTARAEAPAQGNVKSAPCGQTTDGRTSGVTVFKPGDVVTVNWVEYVNHPSYFRVAFQPDGDTFPMRTDVPQANTVPETAAEQVSAEQAIFIGSTAQLLGVVQDNNTSTTATLSTQVTLPDVSCENCTLQIVQVMYNNPPQDGGGYYQCADIAIRSTGATAPSGEAGAAGAANSGAAGSTSVASGGTTGAAGTTGTTASGGAPAAASGGTGGTGGAGNGGPSGPSSPSAPVGSASNGASSPTGTPPATATGTSNGSSAASTTSAGVGSNAAPTTATESSDDGGGCSFEASSGARSWTLWGLAPAALIFARRLRRRSARS